MLAACALIMRMAWVGPEPPGPVEPAPEVTTHQRIERVLLDADIDLYGTLAEALALRLAGISIEAFAPAAVQQEVMQAYVHVRRLDDDAYQVSIILSDGRAYERHVAASEDMAGRIVGSELALLLRGLEEGTLQPDREGAAIPSAKAPQIDASEDPERSSDTPTAPGPDLPNSPPSPADDDAGSSNAARLELGPRVALGGLLGLAPAGNIGDSGAAAGMLGLDLRWPSGAALSVDVRLGGHRSAPFSLIRTRIALGGGYVLRRRAFEMPVLAHFGVEPWGVRRQGRGTDVHPLAGTARQVPLLGVSVRAAPGVRVSIAGRPALLMRLGPFVELSGSAAFSDGVGVPRLYDATTQEVVARLGGLEAALGLTIQVWLAVGRSSPRTDSPSP